MILSKSCEYGIRAAVYIAYKSSKGLKAGITEISDEIGSPVHFTGKILQQLSRKKVISAIKGPNGGYFIENSANVYLVDIVRAIDGNELFSACVMGLKNCSDLRPCPMHEQIKPVRTQLLIEFSKKSVQELVQDYEQNKYFLK
ncbi:MAG: Rrf2 family transcriptional regulator [Sphingobacteriaceae bacterium]|jgi:Rrf2 family protein|nr:Rrf2 family transcriptional regulator [Sphingobacteriaceae bacterium]